MTETNLVPEQVKLLKAERLMVKLAASIAALGGYAQAADQKLGVTTATDFHPEVVKAAVNLAQKLTELHEKVEVEALNAQAIILASGGDGKGCQQQCMTALGLS